MVGPDSRQLELTGREGQPVLLFFDDSSFTLRDPSSACAYLLLPHLNSHRNRLT